MNNGSVSGNVTMLTIKNLHATVDNIEILKGIDLHVNAGEVHAIMGPNGSGKTTLSNTLAGRDGYAITKGEILFCGENILPLSPEARAALGIFLAMQYPVEIPGVNNSYFLKTALNAIRKEHGESILDAYDFMELIKKYLIEVGMDEKFLKRSVNAGFSGGEKKRNEILQMLLLQPKLAICDETDSGLDVDALQIVAKGMNALRSPKHAILMITHYQRLLDYVKPDFVHILMQGKIVKSGNMELAQWVEKNGYEKV